MGQSEQKHHVAILDEFAPALLKRCAGRSEPARAMKEEVEDFCYEHGQDYDHVMNQIEKNGVKSLEPYFRRAERTRSPDDELSRTLQNMQVAGIQSAPGDRATPGAHSIPGARRQTVSEPGLGLTHSHPKPARKGWVVFKQGVEPMKEQLVFISSSNTEHSFITDGVLQRLGGCHMADLCDPVAVPHLEGVCADLSNRCINLVWFYDGVKTTHDTNFYVLENSPSVEIFLATSFAGSSSHNNEARTIVQPVPQRAHHEGIEPFWKNPSYHDSSNYSHKHPAPLQPQETLPFSLQSVVLPTMPASSAAAATPRAPPSAPDTAIPLNTDRRSTSTNWPKLIHKIIRTNRCIFLDIDERSGAKYLDSLADLFYDATAQCESLDRSTHTLIIRHLNPEGEQEEYMCPLKDDSFEAEWPEALNFIKERLPLSHDFNVELRRKRKA